MIEPLWRNGTGIERPFSAVAGVRCRCSSLALQRVMTDFRADEAFGRVPEKLKEHDGIEMPVSTIQRTTAHHAQRIYDQEAAREIGPGTAAEVIFVGELDGSMVPVVEPSPAADDKRKGKVLSWKEVRLNLVHPQGSLSARFGGNFTGGVEESGRQWWRCAAKAGFGPGSQLHAVGDGAPWIANQVEMQFGTQGSTWWISSISVSISVQPPRSVPLNNPQAWLEVRPAEGEPSGGGTGRLGTVRQGG